MTLFITGSPCRKGEPFFTDQGGFVQKLKERIASDVRILMITASPDDVECSRAVFESTKACLDRSGITYSGIDMLERSNADKAGSLVKDAGLVILCGGHVPTQNAFFRDIDLKNIIKSYDGVIVACSAGSMNCADFVYSHPELMGESIDPSYSRALRGLGLTDINIVPHLEDVRNAILDDKRLFEDIIYTDSWGHPLYTFPDGTYILSENGRETLYGEAWLILDGKLKQISAEGGTYTFMNAIFISPHFPQTYSHFCAGLKDCGVNVLGIADAPYGELNEELRSSLTEYYRVTNLEDYDQVYRAVAYFAYKYGKIDWIESNNEYWLEQDARLRTDFNVTTGVGTDYISTFKEKSEMKKRYIAGGIPTARQIKGAEGFKAVKAFTKKTGYPIIAKPDNGVGADGTFKICSDDELEAFFASHPDNYGAFVIEEFITGLLVSYDAIVDSKGDTLFENMTVFPTPIMDIVHGNLEIGYWAEKTVPAALSKIGRRTIKAFGVKSRFVHFEFFKLDRDREGLGKKGDYVGLEVNMRPAGGYTPELMDYAHSTDVYRIWAEMVAYDARVKDQGSQYFCAYGGRRDGVAYAHSHEDILAEFGDAVVQYGRMPDALSSALCNQYYIARLETRKEVDEFLAYVVKK